MAMQFSSGKTDFELTTSFKPAPEQTPEQRPFCIAIMADFSGRGNRGLCQAGAPLAARRWTLVDVDNFEKLPEKLGAELHIPIGDSEGPRLAVRLPSRRTRDTFVSEASHPASGPKGPVFLVTHAPIGYR